MKNLSRFYMPHIGQRYFWALLVFLLMLPVMGTVFAANPVCAEVKIVIEQKLSFERQAFDAKMVINNGLDTSKIEDVNIELLFLDKNNKAVVATQDPNAVGAKFFYRTDSMSGISEIDGHGIVAPKASAEIHWMIIPSTGAAEASDTLYYVGAKVTYTLNGVTTTVEVTPDYIVVRPQPLLTLDYFLPTQVYADDPFTEEVEEQVPFTLGVRIKNSGKGAAVNTKIESAQPKIVENKQNLLIGFEILGGYVSDEAAGKSLLLDFGDIEAASSKVGRWNMVTTLSGKFIEFDASFTHADNLGGAVTSLLQGVFTHTLVHDVKVDLPGRDNVRDFLALDNDVMRVYESEGVDTVVTNQSAKAKFTVGSSQAQLTYPATPSFVYAKVNDPYQGTKAPEIVRRSDGKVISKENVWLSKVFNQDTTWSYYINVFDVDSTGSYTFFFDQENKALLTGIVYLDANGNGVMDKGEQGLQDVGVTLSVQDGSSTNVVSIIQTNASGVYTFVNLQAGEYTLEVSSVNGMNDGVAVAGNADGTVSLGKITGIDLVAGINAKGYFFAKKSTTAPKASVSGIVYFDANGNGVMDGDEKGIGAVDVTLSVQDGSSSNVVSVTQTNASGVYTFDSLQAGRYTLDVSPVSGMNDGATVVGSAGGTVALGKITGIDLGAGVNAQNYLFAKKTIVAEKSSLSGIVYYDANSNGAMDGDESGISLVAVALSGQSETGVNVRHTAYTDALGKYAFDDLQAGQYTLVVSSVSSMNDGAAMVGSAGGTVAAGKITGINLSASVNAQNYLFAKKTIIAQGASLSGIVYFDANGNGVLDGDEKGIGAVDVSLSVQAGSSTNVISTIQTNATGAYTFDNLQAGKYALEVSSVNGMNDGVAVAGSAGGTVVAGKITGIDLSSGVNAKGYLFAKKTIVAQKSSISGIVYLDANGNGVMDGAENGIEAVEVSLVSDGEVVSVVQTNVLGAYTLDNLQVGKYALEVSPVNGMNDGVAVAGSVGGVAISGKVSGIELSAGVNAKGYLFAKKTIIAQKASISGIVYFDANGNGAMDGAESGIEAAEVSLVNGGGNVVISTTQTNASGSYSFEGLDAGQYTLAVSTIEGMNDGVAVAGSAGGTVVAGKITGIDLSSGVNAQGYLFAKKAIIAPKASLSGIVYLDANGNGVMDSTENGIEAAEVSLVSDGEVVSVVQTNASGSYSFEDLSAGQYTLAVSAIEGMNDGVAVAGSAGGVATSGKISGIELSAGVNAQGYLFAKKDVAVESASISGVVYFDANSNKAMDGGEPGMSLVAVALSGQSKDGADVWKTTFTDETGAYAFNDLQAGQYRLEVASRGWMVDSSSLAGQAGGMAELSKITQINLIAGVSAQGYQFAKQESTERDKADIQTVAGIDNPAPSVGETINVRILSSSFLWPAAKDMRLNIIWPEGLSDINCQDRNGKPVFGQWYFESGTEIICSAKAVDSSEEQVITISVNTQSANLLQGFSDVLIPLWAKDAQHASIIGGVYNDKNGSTSFDGMDEGLANVAVTLSGQDGNGHEVSQVAYTNNVGMFAFTGLNKGVYSLEVEAVSGMSDSLAIIGRTRGEGELGKISNIQLESGQIGSTYLFTKRQTSELNADLMIIGVAVSEDGTPITEVTAGQTIYTYFAATNSGLDIALGTKAKITWTSGLSDTACYQMVTDESALTGDELFIENPIFSWLPSLPILNGEWEIGMVVPEYPTESLDINPIALCITNSTTAKANQSITAHIESQTPDPDTSSNSATVIFNQVDASASLAGTVYFDANGNKAIDGDEPGMSLVAVALSGQSKTGENVWKTTFTDETGAYAFNDLQAGQYKLEVASQGWMMDSSSLAGQAGGVAELSKITQINLNAGVNAQGYLFAKQESTERDKSNANLSVFFDNKPLSVGETINIRFFPGSHSPSTAKDIRFNVVWPEGLSDISCVDSKGEAVLGQSYVDLWHNIYCSAKVVDLSGEQVITASVSTQSANLSQSYSSMSIPLRAKDAQQHASLTGVVYNDKNGNTTFDGVNEGLANVAVVLTGRDEKGQEISQVAYTNNVGVFTFPDLNQGVYTLKVDAVSGLSDSVAFFGRAGGKEGLGEISNINLQAGQIGSAYLLAKRAFSEINADLGIIYAFTVNENGDELYEPSTGVQVGDKLDVFFVAENFGPDWAAATTIQLDWTKGLKDVTCYGVKELGFDEGEGDVQYIDNPYTGEFPALAIENGRWNIGYLKPVEIDEGGELYFVYCTFQVGSLTGNQSIAANLTSQTPDPNSSNNSHTIVFNQVDASASISGMVYALGDEGSDTLGVANVVVELYGQDGGDPATPLVRHTDEAGAFVFSDLTAGRYTLHARPVDGMLDGASIAGDAGGITTPGFINNISLGSGVNVGEYQFEKRTGVAGTGSLSGKVVYAPTAGGAGISGAKVYLFSYANGRRVQQSTYTDVTGAFTFNSLIEGYYSLSPEHVDGTTIQRIEPGNAGGFVAAVDIGRIDNIQLREGMHAQRYSFTRALTVGSASISGKVYLDANGNGVPDNGEVGIAGSKVHILFPGIGGNGTAAIHTDASGDFLLNSLPKGFSALSADFGSRMFDGKIVAGTLGGNPQAAYITAITLLDGVKGEGYYFGYKHQPRSSSITGTVYVDTNGNGIFDENEAGIGGVKVLLTGQDENYIQMKYFVYTDVFGRFIFEELSRGGYSLRVGLVDGTTAGVVSVGTVGGNTSTSVTGLVNLSLNANETHASDYNFAKLVGEAKGTPLSRVANVKQSNSEPTPVINTGTCLLNAQNSGATSNERERIQQNNEQPNALGVQAAAMAQHVSTDCEETK